MAKSTTTRRASRTPSREVTVRMYRHGLGDCFLVRLPKAGGKTFNLLIDCGLVGVASDPMTAMGPVVDDISTTCDRHLDAVALTHEHWDHVSGFSEQQTQSAFAKMTIDQAWYAWTEEPANKLGQKLRAERAAKLKALRNAAVGLRRTGVALDAERAGRVESLLRFFGAVPDLPIEQSLGVDDSPKIGKTRAAFEYLINRRAVQARYLHPDKPPFTLPGVEGVRVYVLGPPKDEAALKRSAPTKRGKEVYELAASTAADDNLAAAFGRLGATTAPGVGDDCPFESSLAVVPGAGGPPPSPRLAGLIQQAWNDPASEWRRIESDWTAAAESLALDLDTHTNNTCLVLAIELTRSGRVLLFPGDAQVGNWLSWQDLRWRVDEGGTTRTVTGPDLLRRTVFYKVGHHGSHNATMRAAGLEQMESEELVAFVPVFKKQAEASRWHEMPFEPLVSRLESRTGGRLVFSDPAKPAPSATRGLGGLSAAQQRSFTKQFTPADLFYEYAVRL